MKALVIVLVILCISPYSYGSSPIVRLNRKLSDKSNNNKNKIKLSKAQIIKLNSPSKYDDWLTPVLTLSSSLSSPQTETDVILNEIHSHLNTKHSLRRTKLSLRARGDNPCDMVPAPCDVNADCSPSSTTTGTAPIADCKCRPGYEGSGTSCSEINPCAKDATLCQSPAKCQQDGPGNYKCQCPPNTFPNGNGCDAMSDHSVQINEEAAKIALDGLKNLEDDKESQLEGFGRDQRLQDIQDRIKDLIKTRRASLNDLQDQEIDRVERKVSSVEQTTQSIADSEQKQANLISELKNELDENDAATERAMREKAEQILDKAKDQVINAHRDNFHFDGNTNTNDADSPIPTAAERARRIQAINDQNEYMASVNAQKATALSRKSVQIVPREKLFVVVHPETHVIPEYQPFQHTTVNIIPSHNHPGKYHINTNSHVDMLPVGVKIQQQQQQEVVAVQQQQLADPNYIVPETRP